MVNVPPGYAPLISQMSGATGIPQNIIAAQANVESGFNPSAVSPAGAEGWLQFLPSTYDEYASAAGVSPGTEFNPQAESLVYDQYMGALLSTYKGNVRNALAAYNAGTANSAAGQQYATDVLSQAGSGDVTVKGGKGIVTTGILNNGPFPGGILDPLNFPFVIGGGSAGGNIVGEGLTSAFTSIMEAFFKSVGITSVKDFLVRSALILVGIILVFVGISKFISISDITAVASKVPVVPV